MFDCIKKCFRAINIIKSPKNSVKIYNNIFIANKKENQIFEESLALLEGSNRKIFRDYENSFIRNFYNFELLVELLNRYKSDIKISDESILYLNLAFEELNTTFRFIMIGYYNSANIHLRLFIENIINFIYNHFSELGLIVYHEKDNRKIKIEKCFNVGQLSYKNKNRTENDVYDVYYFNSEEFYRIYKHLSDNFVHKSYKNTGIIFSEKEFNNSYVILTLTLSLSARFIKTTIGLDVEKYWRNRILNQIDDYPCYRNYLQFLFNENKIFSNQFSGLYNLIHDNKKENYELIVNKIGLKLENIFSPEYIEQCNAVEDASIKSKGNKDIYTDLMVNYYTKLGKKQNKKNNI